ncbi:MAG: Xaa-Pro aminopeptidase [Granulosicoccus sp.]|jgi:Xaa-Pro aminopeptidase
MRYDKIDTQLFVNNRQRFIDGLVPLSIAVFNSNDIMPTSADGAMPFKQATDILHLSGIDQEESILVLFPNSREEKHREILFLKETSDLIAVWEGAKLTKEQATDVSGIKTVYWLSQFESIFNQLMCEASHVYLNSNEHGRANTEVETREARFVKWCMDKYPLHKFRRSAPIMHSIRGIKSDIEVALIQKACDITEAGFRRVLKMIKPGVMEYEIEAEYMHEFLMNRSTGFAYTPIIGSGASSCVLHYVENNKECKDGDILLMDVGAEYANYDSDMTRSIPVNGRYSDRQKEVYNSVLKVMNGAIKMLRPGMTFKEYNAEVGRMMESELLALRLISTTDIENQDPNWPAFKKYFMHGTSHHLGLDTHDSGYFDRPMEAGMVFTCEPGIYIPEENIGIRIEDDLVLTNGEPFNLMKNIPKEIEEIEEVMNS